MPREMKDSGIKWIGKIPSDWDILRLSHSSTLKGRIGWQGLRTDEYQEEGPYLITGTDFSDGIVNWTSCAHISEKRFEMDKNIQVKEDDLLITKDGTIGKVAVVKNCPDKACLNSGVFILRNDKEYKYDNKYVYYVLNSNQFSLWYELNQQGESTIKHLTQERFYKFSFTYPPLSEQHCIASFLDDKCAEIDALSADIQKQIEKLEEYKRSVITEAVTKGLDPNVGMKDSGIEWAEQIPSHWRVMPNKYVMNKKKEVLPMYQGEDILSLTMNGVVVRDLNAGGKMPSSFDGYQKIEPGNLLMCLFDYDVTPRCIGLIKNEGVTSPAYSQFAMKNGNYAPYYYYYYLMIDFTKELLHLAKNLRHSFTEEQLGMIDTPVPPINEQMIIATHLDNKCDQIESAIATKQQQLSTLEEYKKSIIYEYVTGKKEVPNANA